MKKTLLLLLAIIVAALQFQSMAQKPYTMKIDGQSITMTLADIKKFWEPQMQSGMADMNRQCPMPMNEYVTMTSVKYLNNTIYGDLRIDINASTLSAAEKKEIKEESGPALMEGLKEGLLQVDTSVMPRSEWLRLFRELDIKFYIRLVDKNGVLITTVTGNTANLR